MSGWTLSPLEAACLWHHAGLDEIPDPHHVYSDEPESLVIAKMTEAAKHLDATITRDQLTAFDILARPSHRITLVTIPAGDVKRGHRILSGFRDGHAVIASQSTATDDPHAATGGSIRITSTTLAKWVTELVAVLPPLSAGRLEFIPDVSCVDEGSPEQPDHILIDAIEDQRNRLRRRIMSSPVDLSAEFLLSRLDTQTTSVLSKASVVVFDVAQDGRYAVYGRVTRSMKPVNSDHLVRLVTDQVSDLKNHLRG